MYHLQVVLEQSKAVIEDREQHGIRGNLESEVPDLISQGEDLLVALEKMEAVVRAAGVRKRDRFTRTWRKHKERVLQIQDEIKRVKSTITFLLAASNSYVTHFRWYNMTGELTLLQIQPRYDWNETRIEAGHTCNTLAFVDDWDCPGG